MNIESLKSALKSALLAELNGDRTMNPAIVYDGEKFLYESALHGSKVVIDLQEGCGNFSLQNIPGSFDLDEQADFAAGQWFDWCADEIIQDLA